MRNPDWVSACGGVRLYRGDCLAIIPELDEKDLQAVVTDPPYSSGGQFRGDRQQKTRDKYQSSGVDIEHPNFSGDNRDQRGWLVWCSLWLDACAQLAAPGAMLCMFTDWRQLPIATDAVQCGGWVWRGIVPWDKVVARPQPGRFRSQAEYMVWATNGPRCVDQEGADYHDGIVRVTTVPAASREHSTQKPVELMEKAVTVAKVGACVLDPFMGSGSTGVACVHAGRRFIGIEREQEYFDIATRRISSAVRKPVFEFGGVT